MVVLLAFAAGYYLGARAGSQDFDDVVDALQAVRQSEEVKDLVGSLRSHAAHTLREVAALLERTSAGEGTPPEITTQDLVDRVRNLVGRT